VPAVELPDRDHPAQQASLGVKGWVMAEMVAWARVQGFANPEGAVGIVFLLLEGVWAAKQMFDAAPPLAGAKEAVRRVLAGGAS
jgi:hypothetical protein